MCLEAKIFTFNIKYLCFVKNNFKMLKQDFKIFKKSMHKFNLKKRLIYYYSIT